MEQKPTSEHAVFTFGRFNPPTTGHKKLVDKVVSHAWRHKADNYIFASHSHDEKKNPLGHKAKIHFMKKFFPHANVHDGEGIKTALDAVKHLHKKGYKKVTMMVGDDRQQEFHNLLHKYNHKEGHYDIPHLEVKSAGQRDPDAEGVEGMSASKMRDHATKRNFKEFHKGVPNPAHAKELYHAVRKGMNLENYQAIFLVGAPGSGKDIILRTVLDESGAKEIPFKTSTSGPQPLIINGNAYDYDNIILEANSLVENGYTVGMIYVYTTDEQSQARNEIRLRNGDKTITEANRAMKYKQSIFNLHQFKDLFGEGFFLFDNSNDTHSLNESVNEQVCHWLNELTYQLENYFQIESIEGGNAGGSVMGKGDGTGDGIMAKDYTKPKKKLKMKEDKDPSNKGNPYMFPRGSGKKPAKKPKEKAMVAPPDFFDQRMGAVPSGGVGITMSSFDTSQLPGTIIKEKTFEKFRKNMSALINNVDKE